MDIKTVASSSAGNMHIVTIADKKFIFDCGLDKKAVQKALNYGVGDISFCGVTHAHKDHAKSASFLHSSFVPLVMSDETREHLMLPKNHNIHTGTVTTIDDVDITQFDVMHDIAGTVGFYVSYAGNNILYVTDTGVIEVNPVDLTHLIIECNYTEEVLKDCNPENWDVIRLTKYHLSLERVLSFLSKIDKSKLKLIVLTHLSSRHGDKDQMLEKVKEQVGGNVEVHIAQAGKEIRK